MAERKTSTKKNGALSEEENTCAYCLYFHSWEPQKRPLGGNCSYYKQWIENAGLTTCNEMSKRVLGEKGIYEIITTSVGPVYIHRRQKQRTRLFLVK